MTDNTFTFTMSISTLNDLGRGLYRNFATILGEAISNSWDANAHNVWIYIDKEKNNFLIKDDGEGMLADDFQEKFLKIGYSKRKGNNAHSHPPECRPYIGKKGIGKLALLSCSKKVTIISKKEGKECGGTIDNTELDKAITDDLELHDYDLEIYDSSPFKDYMKDYEKGTIIYFEDVNSGIRNRLDMIKKIIASDFRFSLIDSNFRIFVNEEEVTFKDLDDLVKSTEFVWNINSLKDPYIDEALKYDGENIENDENIIEPKQNIEDADLKNMKGFIASVRKPKNLSIYGTGERIGVDLFVNGRVREKNILIHIPTSRITENYLYGQIHLDTLDSGEDALKIDRFTSNREQVIPDDEKYQILLKQLKEKIIPQILKEWDYFRRKHSEDGDIENKTKTISERKSEELFNAISNDYKFEKSKSTLDKRKQMDEWLNSLSNDASFNFVAYANCFISENVIRKYIEKNKITFSDEIEEKIDHYFNTEKGKIKDAHRYYSNIDPNIKIRNLPLKSNYLSMNILADVVDKNSKSSIKLGGIAKSYEPFRNALMHTSLLTQEAKDSLEKIKEEIKKRIKGLL